MLVLFLLIMTAAVHAANVTTIQNEFIGASVDLEHGCSLSGAFDIHNRINLINTFDLGRYVQASYYSGPDPYDGCRWRSQPWPWNPISAGDSHGHAATVLSFTATDTSVNCTIRPMQWACDNVPCECTIQMSYHLEGSTVRATYTLDNERSDKTAYPAQSQEIPAVYVNAPLNRLYGYTGAHPCTNDTLTLFPSGWNNSAADPWIPGNVRLTEPWLAFVQPDSFGVGVWSNATLEFKGGFSGTKGPGDTHSASTGYIAPLSTVALPWNARYTYRYAIILGNLVDIRATACRLK